MTSIETIRTDILAVTYVCLWCGATSPSPQRQHAQTCAARPIVGQKAKAALGSGLCAGSTLRGG